MKKVGIFLVCMLFMLQASAAAVNENTSPVPGQTANDYVLHTGDMLAINVYGYPELSFPSMGQPEGLTVRPDGKITYPFLGEIQVQGLTAKELTKLLSDRLGELYVNPTISVNVMRFGTERVYVLGEVNQPGSYELDKSRNLLDAIGAARGWTKDAAKTKVYLIRKGQQGQPPTKINLMSLLKDGDTSVNVPLQPGDVIFLSGNNRIDFARDIVPVINAAYLITWISSPNSR